MFNEAFMFFWLIGAAGDIDFVCGVIAIIGGLAMAFLLLPLFSGYDDDANKAKKAIKVVGIAVVSAALIGVITPPKTAFYAGAAQYIGEAGELDKTLIDLKKLLDQKIEELSEESE